MSQLPVEVGARFMSNGFSAISRNNVCGCRIGGMLERKSPRNRCGATISGAFGLLSL